MVIGGRNKYLINGSNANNTRVQDLFRSVQLNVNNPHFLIMQGRITKVLNMKPPEVNNFNIENKQGAMGQNSSPGPPESKHCNQTHYMICRPFSLPNGALNFP